MIARNIHSYDSVITEMSQRYGVSASLIKAVIQQESNWDVSAIRQEPQINDASLGLMQVLVKTGQWILNNDSLTADDLYWPRTNIEAGTKYLAFLLKRYGGDIKKSIAAYNAGSARYKFNGDFINQKYVDNVYGYYQNYLGFATVERTLSQLDTQQMSQGTTIDTTQAEVSTSDVPDVSLPDKTGTPDDSTATSLPFNPVWLYIGVGISLFGGFEWLRRWFR